LSVLIGDDTFYSVLCIAHILQFFINLAIGDPKMLGALAEAQSAPPLIRHCPFSLWVFDCDVQDASLSLFLIVIMSMIFLFCVMQTF